MKWFEEANCEICACNDALEGGFRMKSSALLYLFLCLAIIMFAFQPDGPATSKWR